MHLYSYRKRADSFYTTPRTARTHTSPLKTEDHRRIVAVPSSPLLAPARPMCQRNESGTLARRLLHYRKRPETVTSGITPSGDLESVERLGP